MPNVAGPRSGKRRALMCVANSIMFYGAEVWADAFRIDKYRDKIAMVQKKGSLRMGSAYRTVSGAAIAVIAGIIYIDLLASERRRLYDAKQQGVQRSAAKA